ncbi:MAG TPA: class I SAM-dependent methyltransferase, partial [Candidatus Binataceae bacterium]|nr:class I SAM-dependent methyltransferase [Candidatus Binataceae bacterium]
MAEPHESRVYSDLAHLYDSVFGRAFVDHEHEIIESLSFRPGHQVLEVGVGTGISLDAYPPYVHVIGIDPSADMLAHAIAKTGENGHSHIEVRKGDAQRLEFADNSFDWVTSFHVMTVVPQPRRM